MQRENAFNKCSNATSLKTAKKPFKKLINIEMNWGSPREGGGELVYLVINTGEYEQYE